MQFRALSTAFALALSASGQVPAPDASEQTALIARMRDAALNYANRLEDFLCTQLTTRSADQSGSGKPWKLLETQELELGYSAHREHYRLLKVNGQTTDLDKKVKRGYFRPGGEFGTSLGWIFDPKASAQFELDHVESSTKGPSCVFRYRVPVTTYYIRDDCRRGPRKVVPSWFRDGRLQHRHGDAHPNRNRACVGQAERTGCCDGMQLDLRYGLTIIASKEFLLPQQAVLIARFGKTLTKAEIQFLQYRKYESSSNIAFEPDKLE